MVDKQSVINKEELKVIEDVVTCAICHKLSFDPYQCNKCDQVFCKLCIENQNNNPIVCLNNCLNSEIKPSRLTRVLLSKLYLSCPNGCKDRIPYEAYQSHCQDNCPMNNYKNKYMNLLSEYQQMKSEHDDLMVNRNFNVLPHQFLSKNHYHLLTSCITNRLAWRCNICTKTFKQKDVSFYCTLCDYDICKACKESEN